MSGIRKRKNTPFLCIVLVFLVTLLVPAFCCAESPVLISVQENEWSWVPGEVATFSGLISCQNPEDLSGATLRLEIIPEPRDEDAGRVVFTAVNDKRIKIRKQSDTYNIDDDDLSGEIPFEGSWFIPEGSAYFKAGLNASVIGKDGNTLASGNISVGSGSNEGNHTLLRIPVDIGRLNTVLAVCTAGICFLAIFRVFVITRKKSTKSEKES